MMAGLPFADLFLKTFLLLLYGTRGCLPFPFWLFSLSLSLFCIARCMNSHSSVRLDSLQKGNTTAVQCFVKLCWLTTALTNNPGICLLNSVESCSRTAALNAASFSLSFHLFLAVCLYLFVETSFGSSGTFKIRLFIIETHSVSELNAHW